MHPAKPEPPTPEPSSEPLPETAISDAPANPAPVQAAMGATVGRGAAWLIVNTLFSKGLSFAAFAVLGGVLTNREVGVWTTAFSFAAFIQFFKDGGVPQLLIQRGERAYGEISGSVFWIVVTCNLFAASLLAGLAPVVSGPRFFDQPELPPLLYLIAAYIAISGPSMVLTARLQMQLRFRSVSNVQMVSSIIRYGTTIVAVLKGLGPMSFVLPLPFMAAFEWAAMYLATRDTPWKRPAKPRMWPELLSQGKWMVFVTLAFAVVNQGPYFLLSTLISADRLGVFSFAYQMVAQVDQVLAATAAAVLFPALAKLNQEPERQAAAALRAARLMVLLSSLACIGLAVCLPWIETLLWGGLRSGSVLPAQIIASVFAWRQLLWVPAPALQARGEMRHGAGLVLLGGLGLMGAAAMGWGLGGDAVIIAVCMGVVMLVLFTVLSLLGLARLGVRARDVLRGTVPAWLCCLAAGALSLGLMHLLAPLSLPGGSRVDAGLRVVIVGGSFTVAALALLRVAAPAELREALGLAPARLRPYTAWIGGRAATSAGTGR
jgi:O-antigen/teichoic acid export membrane protein